MSDEISLRELLQVLLSRRRFIVIVTASFLVLSTVINVFILSPQYESYSIIKVNQEGEAGGAEISGLVQQVNNDYFLSRIIADSKINYTLAQLKANTQAEVLKGTNLIKVKVKATDSKLSAKIANIIAVGLGSYAEIASYTNLNTVNEKRLMDIENQLKVVEAELSQANEEIKKIDEKLATKKTLSDSPYLQSVLSDSTNLSNKKLGEIQLNSEEINPVYLSLKSKIAEAEIQQKKLKTEQEYLKDQVLLNQVKIEKLQILQHDATKDENKLLLSGNSLGSVIITPAIEPIAPSSPNKVLNIFLFTLLGGIVSIIYAIASGFIGKYFRGLSNKGNVPL